MLTNIKNYILYGIIILVAVITGVAIGSIYIDGIVPSVDTSSLTEATLRDDEEMIKKLYEDAVSGKKTTFSAVELYQIGEYKLKNTDKYVKILSGDVVNMMGSQSMRAIKTSTEEGIYYLKMSPGIASMSVKQKYEYNNPNEVYLNETRNKSDIIGDNKDNYLVNLDETTAKTITLDEYKSFFNTLPTTPLTYIVSSFTTQEGTYDKDVTLNSDNKYVFNIKMTGEYASYAAFYYSYEIRHFAGFSVPTTPPDVKDLPAWKSVEMTVTMNENFEIEHIHYDEVYQIEVMSINSTVTDDFDDYFYYDDETVAEYLEVFKSAKG